MSEKRWILFDIGCLECCEDSAVVGVYTAEAEAQAALDGYLNPDTHYGRPEWRGQHSLRVFEVTF